MNARELTLAAVRGNTAKIPFNPFIMHMAATLAGVDYCHSYCQDPGTLADSQIRCAQFFGIHHVNVSTDAFREASAWGVEINWEGGTPDAKRFLAIKEFDSIEMPDVSTAPRTMQRIAAVKQLHVQAPEQCVFGWIEAPFAEICCLFGLRAVFGLRRAPDWAKQVRTLIERILPVQREFAKLQIEAGADVIGAGDSIVSQIGPHWYEACARDATQTLFNEIQRHIPVLYHVCGDTTGVDQNGRDLLKLIASTDASVIDLDYQVNLLKAREKMGTKVCLRGNTNTQILGSTQYSPEEVIAEVRRIVEEGKASGHYMYAAGCEWPWEPRDVAIRNLSLARALVERENVS